MVKTARSDQESIEAVLLFFRQFTERRLFKLHLCRDLCAGLKRRERPTAPSAKQLLKGWRRGMPGAC